MLQYCLLTGCSFIPKTFCFWDFKSQIDDIPYLLVQVLATENYRLHTAQFSCARQITWVAATPLERRVTASLGSCRIRSPSAWGSWSAEQQEGAAIPCWQHQAGKGSDKLSFFEVSYPCSSHHLPEQGTKHQKEYRTISQQIWSSLNWRQQKYIRWKINTCKLGSSPIHVITKTLRDALVSPYQHDKRCKI